jgi:thiamine phosphate synthase YjbQ (UPF0047 family)
VIKGTRVARGLHADYEEWLEGLAPHEPISRYRHNRTGEACPGHSVPGTEYQGQSTRTTETPTCNARHCSGLQTTVMGREVVVAITDGRFDLRPWEQIFYGEFDGRRRKRVLVKIIGE